jgi:hypothetical protein
MAGTTLRGPFFTRFDGVSPFVSLTSQPLGSPNLFFPAATSTATLRGPVFTRYEKPNYFVSLLGIQGTPQTLLTPVTSSATLRGPVFSRREPVNPFVSLISQPLGSSEIIFPVAPVTPTLRAPVFTRYERISPFVSGLWTWNYPPEFIPPYVPPPQPVIINRCVYTIASTYSERPSTREQSGFYVRHVKQGSVLTWTASFYNSRGIIGTPVSATLTVNYTTRAGLVTLVMPMVQNGFFSTASWSDTASALALSTATWTINAPSLSVTVNGTMEVYGRYPM